MEGKICGAMKVFEQGKGLETDGGVVADGFVTVGDKAEGFD